MNIELICSMRVLQVIAILLFGGVGMVNILNPPKERPSWDWEGDVLIGKKAQILGVFFIVLMFIVLAVTEHSIIKNIKPKSWEFATTSEKVEMLHNDVKAIENNLNRSK